MMREKIARDLFDEFGEPGGVPWEQIHEKDREWFLTKADEILALMPGEPVAWTDNEALYDLAENPDTEMYGVTVWPTRGEHWTLPLYTAPPSQDRYREALEEIRDSDPGWAGYGALKAIATEALEVEDE